MEHMMISSYLVSLTLFVVASTGTPGPNNLMMLSSGLNFGIKKSIPHWLGICTGVPLMVFAMGFGLDTLFQRWPMVFSVLKIAGIAYLIFLAYKIATNTKPLDTTRRARPMNYIQAALFQWVNPKAWIMVVSAITAFTSQENALLPQVAVIATIFLMVGLICVGSWLFAGAQLQRLLTKPAQQTFFNWGMAALLICSIAPMAFVQIS